MKLIGCISKTAEIKEDQLNQMFNLMNEYYDNISWESFMDDLSEKDWVILLESEREIKGFSTQKLIEHTIDKKNVSVVFSGDTIIDKSCWGTLALPITFGRMMMSIKALLKDKGLYWFLISKGYRTYRFLPVFFNSFYPSPNSFDSQFEKRLLREVASKKFGSSFNAEKLIINASGNSQKLKADICDISEQRGKDRYIAYFEKSNPGYTNGDELACMAKFEESNLTPFILKRIYADSIEEVLL
jgi:hypothetical protein